jgi:nucleotide-binding universal stress UspA family protein
MIRSILIPIADGPVNASARDFAFWLAKKDGSRIHALAVIDVKAFEIPVLGTPDGFLPSVVTPPLAENQSLINDLTGAARDRTDQIARDCQARGIPCSTDIRTGVPGDLVARAAVAYDLVVMGRMGYSRASGGPQKIDPLVSHVIRASIRPVLVAGSSFPEGDIRSVLVAYDGSVHAGRALMWAADMGGRPGVQCILLTVAPSEEAGEETLAPAAAFLAHHNVIAKKQVAVGAKPSEVICGLVASARADLLVMGAYGHRPIREVLFGSTTERVLSHCGTSVILQS